MDRGCRMVSNSGFYLQAKMDLDPKSWWHNLDFISAHGGRLIPGDATPREVLALESWDTVRRDMIVLLLRELVARKIPGEMAELGVFRGLSARLIHHYLPERKLYLFDTFTGFDERDVKAELAATGHKTERTAFSQTGVKNALANIAPLNSNVEVLPGFFPESAPAFLARQKFAFVHLDADLHDPILAGLSFFYSKIVPGGFILVHDYNSWLGARKAVTDFFRDKPETPIPMPDKSGSALILKLARPPDDVRPLPLALC
ncbi:MAG: TylF/MycF/NovP-related O-methyltransferase [Limisphaerales bacterium]